MGQLILQRKDISTSGSHAFRTTHTPRCTRLALLPRCTLDSRSDVLDPESQRLRKSDAP